MCKKEGFDFITNNNIIFTQATPVDEGLYYKDGLHLNGAGRQTLMDNFIHYLNMHWLSLHTKDQVPIANDLLINPVLTEEIESNEPVLQTQESIKPGLSIC